jgi:hypothetical protein
VGRFELLDVVGRERRLAHGPLGAGQLGARRLEPTHRRRRAPTLGLEPVLELVDLALELDELVGQLGRPLGRHVLDG